jgi:hypothetical protein
VQLVDLAQTPRLKLSVKKKNGGSFKKLVVILAIMVIASTLIQENIAMNMKPWADP